MKSGLFRMILAIAVLVVGQSTYAIAQTKNSNTSAKTHMKESGKETVAAGKSLGSNLKHGRVVRGGKHFGKHVGKAGKHFGKGTAIAAKKTGKAVKNAAKP
jgi:hypothetical protein